MPVVEVLNSGLHNSGYSRYREMMPLLRCLFFIAEHFHLQVEAVHLPGKENGLADALSNNNIPHFQQAFPGAAKSPTHLPRQAGTGTVSGGTARLDITALDIVCQLYRQGLAQATQQAYASGRDATSTSARD